MRLSTLLRDVVLRLKMRRSRRTQEQTIETGEVRGGHARCSLAIVHRCAGTKPSMDITSSRAPTARCPRSDRRAGSSRPSAAVNSRRKRHPNALARLAMNQQGRPSDSITPIGITGTNGKTTSNFLVRALLGGRSAPRTHRNGSVSRTRCQSLRRLRHRRHCCFIARLPRWPEHGAKAVTMESRHARWPWDGCTVCTSRRCVHQPDADHLDRHDGHDYFAAKCRLFSNTCFPLGGRPRSSTSTTGSQAVLRCCPRTADCFSLEGPADVVGAVTKRPASKASPPYSRLPLVK